MSSWRHSNRPGNNRADRTSTVSCLPAIIATPSAALSLSPGWISSIASSPEISAIAKRYIGRSDIRLNLQQQADLVAWEYQKRWERGETWITREQLTAWFPDLTDLLTTLRPFWNCPKCRKKNITIGDVSANEVACPRCQAKFPVRALAVDPDRTALAGPESGCSGLLLLSPRIRGDGSPGTRRHGGGVQGSTTVAWPHRSAEDAFAWSLCQRGDASRFRVEAEAVARLQHPNIVQVYEVGEHAGLPYFALEFCAGGSLHSA